MRCDFQTTDEVHRSGRQVMRCKRSKCGQKGLQPFEGRLVCKCRGVPRASEWGCWLSLAFEVFWITPSRVQKVKKALGFKKRCKCPDREEQLNTMVSRFHQKLQRLFRRSKKPDPT